MFNYCIRSVSKINNYGLINFKNNNYLINTILYNHNKINTYTNSFKIIRLLSNNCVFNSLKYKYIFNFSFKSYPVNRVLITSLFPFVLSAKRGFSDNEC